MIDYTFEQPTTVTTDQILNLYQSVGWTAYTQAPKTTLAALQGSVVLWALADAQLIGLARGITDGHTILYIQDILVDPRYQRQHVGTELVHRFLQHHDHIGQTVLLTDPDAATAAFYQSLGFLEVTPKAYGRAFVLDRRFK